MKSKILMLLVATLEMAGCTSNGAAGGTSGKVDCYSIRVTEGESTIFNETYDAGYSSVYEYKSADGKKLYSASHIYWRDYNTSAKKDAVIRAYPDRYTNDYTEYSFSRFVGFLTRENNYYLDLGARTIDSETKWSEYKYASDPTTVSEGASNNKEAYNCAKSNYYQDLGYLSDQEYVTLRLDLTDSSLERHTYTMLGQDSVITYRAKWF